MNTDKSIWRTWSNSSLSLKRQVNIHQKIQGNVLHLSLCPGLMYVRTVLCDVLFHQKQIFENNNPWAYLWGNNSPTALYLIIWNGLCLKEIGVLKKFFSLRYFIRNYVTENFPMKCEFPEQKPLFNGEGRLFVGGGGGGGGGREELGMQMA